MATDIAKHEVIISIFRPYLSTKRLHGKQPIVCTMAINNVAWFDVTIWYREDWKISSVKKVEMFTPQNCARSISVKTIKVGAYSSRVVKNFLIDERVDGLDDSGRLENFSSCNRETFISQNYLYT